MKKLCTVFVLLVTVSTCSFAQRAFQQGTSDLNLGFGIGNIFWGSGYSASFPVNPSASFEYGVTDNVSVGAVLSYSSVKISGYDIKASGILVGGRGSYHFLTSDKWDPYVGLTLGYVIVSVTDNTGGSYVGGKLSGVGLGIHAGARYFFQDNLGVYAELGASSFAIINLGVTFKF